MNTDSYFMSAENLAIKMQGVWWLLSREDHTRDGEKKIDPVLGADPIGILSYAKKHFAAPFMKRDRTGAVDDQVINAASKIQVRLLVTTPTSGPMK
jgi:hypothetical protein